ncbi:Uncharacterised protein [Bordetella ansorpii]|uniref:Glycosyltransferase RgtA/B/C/D-like domain-containing protein n=1 Tax=Bordetella ansorpii TaxID=288768 RepID=A0A157S9N0_9BORD|nr:glycosyltransferase family 39 protein [Bordetella ansorpii]SAI67140.1 Uncharacterised protein [Bordetella ansorpii]
MIIASCSRSVLDGLLLGAALLVAGLAVTSGVPGAMGFVAAGVTFAAVAWLSRWPAADRILFALFAVALGGWTFYYSSHQVSDFGVYFRCGSDYVRDWTSLQDWTRQCTGEYLPGFATYWRRSLLYSLPIGWVSGGGSYLAFKIANALAHLIAVALLYRGVRQALGRRAGVLAAAALALYPEFWFSTSLVVSDNFAVTALVCLGLAVASLQREDSGRYGAIIAVACLVLALDLLRSVGPILVVAMLFITLGAERASRAKLLAASLGTALAVYAGGSLPAWFGLTTLQTNGVLASIVGNGLTGPRGWFETYTWHQYVLPLVPVLERGSLMAGVIAQDLLSVHAAPLFWLDKLRVLFGGDGYYMFSTALPTGGNPDDVPMAWLKAPMLTYVPFWSGAMRGMVAFFFLAAGTGALRLVRHPLGRASVAIAVAFMLYIVLLGEVQPRYSVLIAPALCVAAAGWAVPRDRASRRMELIGATSLVAAIGIALLGLGTAWAAATTYLRHAPRLHWQSVPEPVLTDCAQSVTDAQIMPRRVLLPMATKSCYRLRAVVEGDVRGDLSFFLMREPMAPKFSNAPHQAVHLDLVLRDAQGKVLRTMQAQLGERVAAVPVSVPGAGLAALDIIIAADGEPGGAVSVGYIHDDAGNAINLRGQ